MISEHRTLRLQTTTGKKFEAEVNFSDNEKIKDCQVVRLHLDGKTIDIKRDELVSLLMVIGDGVDQRKLMPLKLTNIKKVERLLQFRFQASKDYKKGEEIQITAPWIDQVVTEDEILSGNFDKRKAVNYAR